jgi:hypothetical protein
MSPNLKPATFRIDQDLIDGLERIRVRDGVGVSEQVRRAIAAWLVAKGDKAPKPERKRVAPRKRS